MAVAWPLLLGRSLLLTKWSLSALSSHSDILQYSTKLRRHTNIFGPCHERIPSTTTIFRSGKFDHLFLQVDTWWTNILTLALVGATWKLQWKGEGSAATIWHFFFFPVQPSKTRLLVSAMLSSPPWLQEAKVHLRLKFEFGYPPPGFLGWAGTNSLILIAPLPQENIGLKMFQFGNSDHNLIATFTHQNI